MINRSLVGKLWLAIIILVILVMFLLGIFLSQFFEDFYFSLKSQELAKNGVQIAEMIASAPDRLEWEEELSMISKYIDAKIVVIDRTGLIRACTMQGRGMHRGSKLEYPDVEKILNGEIIAQRGTYPGVDTVVLSVGVPIKDGDNVIGAVFLNSPVEPVTQIVRTVQSYILYGAIGTIFLATILGFILTKRITKPILDINSVAMSMAKGNFRDKVDIKSEDEIGLLGSTLNYLSSELQKNIDDLSTEKDQLENILTSMSDAVITVDSDGQIILMNPPARELFEIHHGESVENTNDYLLGEDIKDTFQKALREEDQIKSETVIGERVFKTGTTPLRNNKEDIRGAVAVLHDVTKEKRLDSLRREFVANVSHELRSPLCLLQGYVEALTDGLAKDENERQKYLKILLDETLRLRRLVNDLLDLTQLETGNMNMKFEKLSVSELVQIVTGRFKPLIEEQNKKLQVSIADDLPLIVGNEDKLQQVLVNLLDNAVKYTPIEGTIHVGAFLNGEKIEIFVADSGPGIPSEDLDQIWERFYKVDKARTREVEGGTGLGLAIVKSIVQAHGGDVQVNSKQGEGTKFIFSIPIHKQSS